MPLSLHRRRLALSPQPSALRADLLAVAFAVLATAACDVTIKDGDVSLGQSQGRATREFSRTYPLNPNGRVEIVNGNGSIDVTVGPPGSVGVNAVLSARAITEERARQVLSEAAIEESATRDLVRLVSARRSRNEGSGSLDVAYQVTVPPGASIELNGTNGKVKASGVGGPTKALVVNGQLDLADLHGAVDAGTVNGQLNVRMADVTAPIRLESTNGRITLEIPATTKATLSARAMNGGLSVKGFDTPESTGRRIRELESELNGGGPEIDVRVMNGGINIVGVQESKESRESKESGEPRRLMKELKAR